MIQWGRSWLLIGAPIVFLACGDTTGSDPTTLGSAGSSGVAAGNGGSGVAGSELAGSGGVLLGRAGSTGTSGAPHAGRSNAGGEAGAEVGDGGSRSVAGGSSDAGAAGGTLAADVLVPIAKAFCAAARLCCAHANEAADLDNCEANFQVEDSTFRALNRGTVSIDAAGLPACLAAYQQASTKCEELPVLSACQGLVHGKQKEHAPCVDVAECEHADLETMACIIADSNGSAGVCAKVPHGKLGDACVSTCRLGENCSFTSYGAFDSSNTYCFEQDGLYCSSDTATCARSNLLGEACGYETCGSANYCDITCKKRSVLGESCAGGCLASLQCIDNQCLSPSFTVGGTCTGQWFGPY